MAAPLARRALLGIELPRSGEVFSPAGMRAAGVVAGSMAQAAGVMPGDLVVRLGPWPLRSRGELRAALRGAGALDSVDIGVEREGAQISLTARVARYPDEKIDGVDTHYDQIDASGARLRVIVTRPSGADRSPAVLFIQGISTDSVDFGARPGAPIFQLIKEWSAEGLVTMRVEKRGVGDSEGEDCETTGFDVEVEDVRAALRALAGYSFVDPQAIFVFGHSVGGMIAPLLAPVEAVRGVIGLGTSAARWLDCVEASARRQHLLRGIAPSEVDRAARREREELERAMNDPGARAVVEGRSAAFHRELQDKDLARAWAQVNCPALLLHGELDWVVSEEEHAAIAQIVNERRPGGAELLKIPGLDHLMTRHPSLEQSIRFYGAGAFDPSLAELTSAFIRRALARGGVTAPRKIDERG